MRIEQVRFKNLNSLAGEWTIDFSHSAYRANGIFTITGPTGAGKTTILDAVCLALYGSTPRLGKVTKRANEIMSRQTGECTAEVTFSTAAGRFRCAWSQHRKHKKSTGELQQHRHELADVETGALLAEKITETAELVIEKTGMTFEQFTRSMLLAQGDFAAFLQASPGDRAPILEQITGTEIYSDISRMVHERNRAEQTRFKELQANAQGIIVLDEEQEEALAARLEHMDTLEQEQWKCLEALRRAREWLVTVERLKSEQANIERRQQDFDRRRQAFLPNVERLEQAKKAMAVDGIYGQVSALREQQKQDTNTLEQHQKALPGLEAKRDALRKAQEGAEIQWNKARKTQQQHAPIIKEVRELDRQIKNLREQEAGQQKRAMALKKQETQHSDAAALLQKELLAYENERNTARDYLKAHRKDERLVEQMALIREKSDAFRKSAEDLKKTEATLKRITEKRDKAIAELENAEAAHHEAGLRLKKIETQYSVAEKELSTLLQGREISEWRKESDALKEHRTHLEEVRRHDAEIKKQHEQLAALRTRRETTQRTLKALQEEIRAVTAQRDDAAKARERLEMERDLVQRMRSLDDERKRLQDGQPCPLCGAVEHPYAEGNAPAPDKTERACAENRKLLDALEKQLTESRENAARQEQAVADYEETISRQKELLKENENRRIELLNVPDMDVSAINRRLQEATERISVVSKLITEADKRAGELTTLRANMEEARRQFNDTDKALAAANHSCNDIRRDAERLEKEREERLASFAAVQEEINKRVKPWGIDEILLSNVDDMLDTLSARRERWREARAQEESAGKRCAEIEGRLGTERAMMEKLSHESAEYLETLAQTSETINDLTGKRSERYGDKDPDAEETRLAELSEAAEVERGKAVEKADEAERGVRDTKVICQNIEQNLHRRSEVLARVESELQQHLCQEGFADEQDYKAACMTAEARKALNDKADALEKEGVQLTAAGANLETRLAEEREKNLTVQPLATLQAAEAACQDVCRGMKEEIGAIRNRLEANRRDRQRKQQQLADVEKQQHECDRWEILHRLIGSSDGSKYREFVQGLTFELMVGQANRQLQGMTDRYLLVRDKEQPLDLNVIDNYQAGEIRSTKNLSGGESFIVSLALALGLSHIAGNKMRVDSLFLDEGFGTLDDDALETALEALSALRETGKLIGVISHVPALRERISTQIQVLPKSGGHSILVGPGIEGAWAGAARILSGQ